MINRGFESISSCSQVSNKVSIHKDTVRDTSIIILEVTKKKQLLTQNGTMFCLPRCGDA